MLNGNVNMNEYKVNPYVLINDNIPGIYCSNTFQEVEIDESIEDVRVQLLFMLKEYFYILENEYEIHPIYKKRKFNQENIFFWKSFTKDTLINLINKDANIYIDNFENGPKFLEELYNSVEMFLNKYCTNI